MREAPRVAALVGLGFGDCGKGVFTDALCRRWPVHTVARFNGGAQAGHNVVLPDGRHHTFSQFGAGTFVPGVHTLLASPVVVHPTALLVEDAFLRRAGIDDALARLTIAASCRLTTPYHQAAGRLRERLRGTHAHGSCGVGVGETVAHAIDHPQEALRFADLVHPRRAREKLAAIRRTLTQALDLRALAPDDDVHALHDDALAERWLEPARRLALQVPPADDDVVRARLSGAGTLLFEGAQGVLLDESRGFHPHTTWSDATPAGAEAVLAAAGIRTPVLRLGIVRAYTTRHGAGPLPTHDAALDALAEPHNADDGWQGRFRRGHPDAVLLRYAAEAAGPLDGLLVSHLDALDRGMPLRWCSSYRAAPQDADATLCRRDVHDAQRIVGLQLGAHGDLAHQARLTALLGRVAPAYDSTPVASAGALLERLADVANCRVRFTARGPMHVDVSEQPR